MPEITADDVKRVLSEHQRRVSAILAAGGIALYLVVDQRATVPDGWVLDTDTDFYIPPNLDLTNLEKTQ